MFQALAFKKKKKKAHTKALRAAIQNELAVREIQRTRGGRLACEGKDISSIQLT